jgi:hypothetical protein
MRQADVIKQSHWNILLRGAGIIEPSDLDNRKRNPDPKIISELNWNLLYFI